MLSTEMTHDIISQFTESLDEKKFPGYHGTSLPSRLKTQRLDTKIAHPDKEVINSFFSVISL